MFWKIWAVFNRFNQRMKIMNMGSKIAAILVFALLVVMPCRGQWMYPATKTVDVTDTYFGKTYSDPYRWLEDLKNPEVAAWFKAQAKLTDDALAKIPARDALAQEWMAMDKLRPAAYAGIVYDHGRVFYKKTRGGENVGKVYYREGWQGAEKLLFDPTTYTAGVTTTVDEFSPSWDGKYVALALSAGGAEWSEIRVLDVSKGTLLPDRIYPSREIESWTKDSESFIYNGTKTSDIKSMGIELDNKTRVHRLGTAASADRDILSDEHDPALGISAKDIPSASIDRAYPDYIQGTLETVQNELWMYYAPASELKHDKIDWKVLCTRADNLLDRGMEFYGDYIYAVTDAGAAHYKVVRTPVKHPDWAHAETVVPEAGDTIQGIRKSRHYLLVVYSNGVTGRMVKYDFAMGTTEEIKLPLSGSVDINCPDWKADKWLVSITSWTAPVKIFDFDAKSDAFTKSSFNEDVTYPGFDQLETKEVEVPGHDGAMIPLSIIYPKGMALDGSHCCVLTGYGAYGISLNPSFSYRFSLATRGVVQAIAHVRGGSEKGEAWYKAGFQTTKSNTWEDFISCAEYLVKNGYTRPEKLSGTGTSAGGILISRAITERPDLFGAALCNVGCANAMRMEFSPNGPVNTPEFGTVKDPVQCAALYNMDGVAHVQKGVKYPAVLGVGGWNDPRVAPWEPGKFVAAVQAASTSGKPVLMKVNYDNGHFTEDKKVTFLNFASAYAFLLWQTGDKEFQPVQ